MFFAELIIPFLIFGTQEMRLIAFVFLAGLQVSIWFTGNFSYLNHLTFVLCLILLSNDYLQPILGAALTPILEATSIPLMIFQSVIGAFLVILQLISLWNYFFPNYANHVLLDWLSPFHLVNRYGIFAVMTTHRFEIVVEGSNDDKGWKEYLFRYKPSEIKRRPRRISPYQPRLDWQIWFLPFTRYGYDAWFLNFIYRLLEGSSEVLKLLRHNPFPDKPPQFIRALVYLYEFTSFEERKETGNWWKRTYIGTYSPILSLNQASEDSPSHTDH